MTTDTTVSVPTAAAEEPKLSDQDRAIRRARELVRRLPVILDTETTGLEYGDQVIEIAVVDLMDLVSTWVGEWSDYHGNCRWQKLENAARSLRVHEKRQAHRARDDAETTRQVLLALASEPTEAERARGVYASEDIEDLPY